MSHSLGMGWKQASRFVYKHAVSVKSGMRTSWSALSTDHAQIYAQAVHLSNACEVAYAKDPTMNAGIGCPKYDM